MSLAFFVVALLLLAIPPIRRLVDFDFRAWQDWAFLAVACVLGESIVDHFITALAAFQH